MLLTPGGQAACAQMMKRLGQQYVQHVNRIYGRSGTLWEGRFRSSVVASERYALACYRYIERNPVRARLVERPGDFPWSSYRCNAQGQADSLLAPHPAYLALASDRDLALHAYRRLFDEIVDSSLEDEIRGASRTGCPVGGERRGRGRPPKMGSDPIF
jgi:putative transposase